MKKPVVYKDDLILPELSYSIVGCAFEVAKKLGGGHKELIYQRALSEVLKSKNIAFREQVAYPVGFNGKTIGRNFFDFLVEGQVIVELKRSMQFSKAHMDQVSNYLKVSGLRLALLIHFGAEGASFKRLVNINPLK